MSLLPGTRIGSYEVVAKLGEGGMGEVYRARDSRLKRDVAMKVLAPQMAGDRDRLARFRREAELLASLNHPGIAQIDGLEDTSSSDTQVLALVIELVEGEDLARLIDRGPVPIGDSLRIARQLAEALDAAHQKGIVHRDLKPANIVMRADGAVKVLDFGLAKAMEPVDMDAAGASPTIPAPALTESGVVLGTPAYMSPEQTRGKTVDTRTDIWAFGCVLFEMLSGRRPFAGETLADTLAAVLERQPDWRRLPDATPDAITRLLQRCLEKDSASRLRDIGDARIEIDAALSASLRAPRGNLPSELKSFVGREHECSELVRALSSSRLLSLIGVGGAGKTRLAMRVASELSSSFQDGVWFIDLAPIASPDLVAQTVASAIGVREAPRQSIRDLLLETLR